METGIPISSISPDEQHVNLNSLLIKFENPSSDDFTQVENLQKLLEYSTHLKVLLNESFNYFKKIDPELKQLVDFYHQNKAIQEPQRIPEIPTHTESISFTNPIQTSIPITPIHSQNQIAPNEKLGGAFGASKRSHQAQQKPNLQKPDKPHSSKSSRSDGSFRLIEQDLNTPAHPLDIWLRSEPIFRALPSADEINLVCQPIDQDQLTATPPNRTPWFDTLRKAYDNTISLIKDKRSSANSLKAPPGEPPPNNAISDYWAKRQPPFQVERMQKTNKGAIHYLLSSFVETRPLPPDHEFHSIPQDDIIPIHVLLPQLECDDYLSHSFEDRLEYELQLAGLGDIEEDEQVDDNMFQDDIESYKNDMKQYQKQIDKIKNEILAKLPEYKRDEERRLMETQEYGAILAKQRQLEKQLKKKNSVS